MPISLQHLRMNYLEFPRFALRTAGNATAIPTATPHGTNLAENTATATKSRSNMQHPVLAFLFVWAGLPMIVQGPSSRCCFIFTLLVFMRSVHKYLEWQANGRWHHIWFKILYRWSALLKKRLCVWFIIDSMFVGLRAPRSTADHVGRVQLAVRISHNDRRWLATLLVHSDRGWSERVRAPAQFTLMFVVLFSSSELMSFGPCVSATQSCTPWCTMQTLVKRYAWLRFPCRIRA